MVYCNPISLVEPVWRLSMNFLFGCVGQPYFDSKSTEAISVSVAGVVFFICVAYVVSRNNV